MIEKMSNVCAGIVLYNPNIERLSDSLSTITRQVDKVVMVNNGSSNLGAICKLRDEYPGVEIIHFKDNMGIAKALNEICRYATLAGFKWALTLDQDTICPEGLVERLCEVKDLGRIGIICPAVIYEGLIIETVDEDEEICEVKGCMTSASLTNLAVWQELGGFRESYFIDYVDNEFCKRLLINGYRILRVNNCKISHQLGDARTVRFLFKRYTGSCHSPLRCYYMIRNNVAYINEYKKHLNVLFEWIKVFYIAWGCVFYAKERRKTIQSIFRGVLDGIKGKLGKYEG